MKNIGHFLIRRMLQLSSLFIRPFPYSLSPSVWQLLHIWSADLIGLAEHPFPFRIIKMLDR